MDVAWVGFVVAALAGFVSIRIYRHAYTYPNGQGYTPEFTKSTANLAIWLGVLVLALVVWVMVAIPYAPVTGMPLLLVMSTGITTMTSILTGLVLGVTRGKKRLTQR